MDFRFPPEKMRLHGTARQCSTSSWACSFVCTLLVWCFAVGFIESVDGAQIRVRKELLVRQSDRALITVTGRVEYVETVSEKEDCSVQAAIRIPEIKVAVVGEWINACSTKLEPTEIAALTENGEVPIE